MSPSDFNSNLRSVLDVAAQHEVPVVLLAFPMQEEASEHLAGLNSLGTPIWAPQLGSDAFFKDDPIHLNESGHRALAESLVQPLEAILSPPNEEADLALPE